MPRSGDATRQSILETAERLIYQHGYAGTSIDRIIADVGITKGAYFHHFKSKADMASALVARYAGDEIAVLEDACAKAARLSDDPLQRLLIMIGLLAEATDAAPTDNPMCFIASYAYQRDAFPPELAHEISAAVAAWYRILRPVYQAAIDAYPPKKDITADDLISFLTGVFEGGFVLSAIHLNPAVTAKHLRMHRMQLELLFGL